MHVCWSDSDRHQDGLGSSPDAEGQVMAFTIRLNPIGERRRFRAGYRRAGFVGLGSNVSEEWAARLDRERGPFPRTSTAGTGGSFSRPHSLRPWEPKRAKPASVNPAKHDKENHHATIRDLTEASWALGRGDER